ncbi:serine dehydratase-like isoform X3 [Struthio camelus]|uniref:serine dehydratase-like isoform X3 n=1 Tax=Struthio camelus TaxID=8801 RepID=UPI003603DA80
MAAQPGGRFHVVSPVLESLALAKAAGTKVYMKLENVQPTGSFKIRGIGYLCQEAAKKGCRHFVCSSGGNAGLAAAYAARKLGLPATVVVPSTTGPAVVQKLRELGAEVEVSGQVWDEANQRALELAETEGWVNIHPFDHPLIWQGHASLVRELKDSLETKPDAVVLSVGGGGLLAGVVAGLREVGWLDVPIVAAETWGAHSLHAALEAGQLVSLPDITRWWRTPRPCERWSGSWTTSGCWWSRRAGPRWPCSTPGACGGCRARGAWGPPWPPSSSSSAAAAASTRPSCGP